LRIYRTSLAQTVENLVKRDAGRIVEADAHQAVVGTGEGVVVLEEVQQEGRKRMGIAEFLRGYPLKVDDRLGSK